MNLNKNNVNAELALPSSTASSSGSNAAPGYTSSLYAEALGEFGTPLELPQCGAWVLERQIPNSTRRDAMGCYPLFTCANWSHLRRDIEALAGRLVSLALVVDPFSPLRATELGDCFDVVKRFKEHFVVNLAMPSEEHVTPHHRHYARKSLRAIKVDEVREPARHLDDWVELYDNLIQRHQLRGIKAFSRESFRRQLQVPGMVMFIARRDTQVIAAHLWYVQGEVAYSHLSATHEIGYKCRATYGVYWRAIETFKQEYGKHVRWLNLGAGAGLGADNTNGLTEFKQGWASDTRPAFFCGKIFEAEAYAELARTGTAGDNEYFPAYRYGEFF